MKNYLFNLGKNAKKASQDSVDLDKKNKVLKDYIILINSFSLNFYHVVFMYDF